MLNCPICSWHFEEGCYRSVTYPSQGKQEAATRPKTIAICGRCGVGIASPLISKNNLEAFYSMGMYWNHPESEFFTAKKYPIPYALALARWNFLQPFLKEKVTPVSILDIGAGHGFLGIVAAKSRQIPLSSYIYVEKDKTFEESFRKTWLHYFPRIDVQIKNDLSLVHGKFDCITLSHVLEHITNPKELLRNAIEKLNIGGYLFIDLPNQDYLFKKDVFPHLLFFNASSLGYLLEDCGIKISFIASYGNDMRTSPLNFKKRSRMRNLFAEIIYLIRDIIPENMILDYFCTYYEMNKKNDNGIWLRAIGQYNPKDKSRDDN